jgi:hypothetical protein
VLAIRWPPSFSLTTPFRKKKSYFDPLVPLKKLWGDGESVWRMGILALVDRMGGVYDKREMCASAELFNWKNKKAMSREGDEYRTNEMPNEVTKETRKTRDTLIAIFFFSFLCVAWLGLAFVLAGLLSFYGTSLAQSFA